MSSDGKKGAADGPPKKQGTMPTSLKYAFGGLAGMAATCFVQPFDFLKTRMQIAGKSNEGIGVMIKNVIANEGFFALYNGLSAGVLRQAVYSTARLGIYQSLGDWYRTTYKGTPTVFASMSMGATAGAAGSFIANPCEVGLIRMMADGRLPENERQRYKHVFDAIFRIAKTEGPMALYYGVLPTMGRAVIVNISQLATYSQFKIYLKRKFGAQENFLLHFGAGMLSGLVTAIVSQPLDIAKTRLQNMKKVQGKGEYSGMIDVLLKVSKNEGFLSLWKGFFPYYFRIGPHTVLTLVFLEQLTQSYYKYVLGTTGGTGM